MEFIDLGLNNFIKFGKDNAHKYKNAYPFPHIVIDNFFNKQILNKILEDFPNNIEKIGHSFNNKAELKLGLNNVKMFSNETNNFINFLNSNLFLFTF